MTSRRTITVSLPAEMQAFIAERLKTGRYGNASEVVRAALRLLAENEPDLRDGARSSSSWKSQT